MESVATALLPPASSEHALGDLAESSHSQREYIRNLASILPRVIWSQVRRRARLGRIVSHLVVIAIVLPMAHGVSQAPLFALSWAWLRLAACAAIWIGGCALAAAYGPRSRANQWNRAVFGATVIATLSAGVLLGVPVLPTILGLALALALLMLLTLPWIDRQAAGPLSIDTLPVHAKLFQNGIWWRNARESAAGAVVLFFNVLSLWNPESPMMLAGHLLTIAGVLFIIGFLHLKACSRAVPSEADTKTLFRFHRREMVRQRDLLRRVAWWYLLPFAPGMLAIVAARWESGVTPSLAALVFIGSVFGFIWKLNLWAARWLDGELQKVDALEVQL